jgi:hypothetical protein
VADFPGSGGDAAARQNQAGACSDQGKYKRTGPGSASIVKGDEVRKPNNDGQIENAALQSNN